MFPHQLLSWLSQILDWSNRPEKQHVYMSQGSNNIDLSFNGVIFRFIWTRLCRENALFILHYLPLDHRFSKCALPSPETSCFQTISDHGPVRLMIICR